jgi:hypothetical protein
MNNSGCFRIAFAGDAVVVAWKHAKAAALLRFLFGEIQTTASKTSRADFTLAFDPVTGEYTAHQDLNLLYQGDRPGQAALLLQDFISGALAGICRKGPALHAAAVVGIKNLGILMPGSSGMGKTTLTGWLIRAGFGYVTDELVCIDPKTRRLIGLNRSLHIKPLAYPLFQIEAKRADNESPEEDETLYSTSFGTLVRPSFFGEKSKWKNPEARIILFPRFQPGAKCCLVPLSPGLALTRLVETVVNARNWQDHSFSDMADLCRHVPAYSLEYGDIRKAEKEIKKIIHRIPVPPAHSKG